MDADYNVAECIKDMDMTIAKTNGRILEAGNDSNNFSKVEELEYEAYKRFFKTLFRIYLDSYEELCIMFLNKQIDRHDCISRFGIQIERFVEVALSKIESLNKLKEISCKMAINPNDEFYFASSDNKFDDSVGYILNGEVFNIKNYKELSYINIFLVYSLQFNSNTKIIYKKSI